MKRAILAVAVMMLAGLSAQSAFALSFSVDVPVQFNLANDFVDAQKGAKPKDKSTNDVSGFMVGASAGWLGLGYEKYDVTLKGDVIGGGTFKTTQAFQLYDIFVNIPFPVIHPVIGYGAGTQNVSITGSGPAVRVASADVSQVFLRLGIPLGPLFDLNLGYHALTAQDAKITGGGGPAGDKYKGSGDTYSVGLRLGW